MSDRGASTSYEAIKAAEKARLQAEFEQRFERDWAEMERLAALYPHLVTLTPSGKETPAASAQTQTEPEKSEHSTTVTTVADLVRRYFADERSSFYSKRYNSRQNAESLCRIIVADLGAKLVADLKTDDIRYIHKFWTDRTAAKGRGDGKAMAHALVTQLRTMVNYGARVLADFGCLRLSFVLRSLRLQMLKPRDNERLTAGQVKAIMSHAHACGLHSMALAQAFQFDCMLRQKDVIGEWVPKGEQVNSALVMPDGKQWHLGICWSQIDGDQILRHTTSKGQKKIEIDLKQCQHVMAEFLNLPQPRPTQGPLIVSEETGYPYAAAAFRSQWRQMARAAGIPDSVRNMDSREKNSLKGERQSNGHAKPDGFDFPPGAHR